MNRKILTQNTTVNLAVTGLMGALVFVATFFLKIEIPVGGDRTMIGFANVFCILSGLLLGPVYGGCAAGFGSFLFDVVGGWFSSAPVTLITKFFMAFFCGLIAHGGSKQENRHPTTTRLIVAAVVGSLSYCVMYLGYSLFKEVLAGSSFDAALIVMYTKAGATLLNAIIADVIAVPFYWALHRALLKGGLLKG